MQDLGRARLEQHRFVRSQTRELSAEDRAMVEFVQRWMPYHGAGDEDIFCRFGIAPRQLYLRVLQLADSARETPSITWATQDLRAFCSIRARVHASTYSRIDPKWGRAPARDGSRR